MLGAKKELSRVLSLLSLVLCSLQVVRCGLATDYQRPEQSPDLPILSEVLRRSGSDTRPEQIHISFAGPGAVSISWVTHSQVLSTFLL